MSNSMKPRHPNNVASGDECSADHHCCYHVAAAKAVLADRERELLEIKGPCRTEGCPLHYAHSGPCSMTTRPRLYGPGNSQCSALDADGLDCAGPAGHPDGSDHANLNGTWPVGGGQRG